MPPAFPLLSSSDRYKAHSTRRAQGWEAIQLLEHLVPAKGESRKKTVGNFLTRLARLGGYLNRTRDAPLGNMVLWRGMTRLTDIHLGFNLTKVVGN